MTEVWQGFACWASEHNQKGERRRPFGTDLVRHCPQGLFSPFFAFLRAIFFRPFRLTLAPTICPWVSEDGLFKISLVTYHVFLSSSKRLGARPWVASPADILKGASRKGTRDAPLRMSAGEARPWAIARLSEHFDKIRTLLFSLFSFLPFFFNFV